MRTRKTALQQGSSATQNPTVLTVGVCQKRGIYIAGIKSITKEEFEATEVDWTEEVE